MREDLIRRSDAIEAVMNTEPVFAVDSLEPYQKTKDVVEALEAIPSADRPQGWIPCSERLPRPYTEVLVCDECGWISLGLYRPCDVTEKDSGWSTLTRIRIPTDGIIAWMPLPEPWKGADDES